jgi:peptide deformylase
MIKPIVQAPNHVLTTQVKTVISFDKRLTQLIKDLKTTLRETKNPKGVGLAAPQIGEPLRVFVMKPRDDSPIRVFVNPQIIENSPEKTDGVPDRENKLEGCLSIPAVWGKVHRSIRVTLHYQNEHGDHHEEVFDGFLATIIQHETDHVNGILFTQRVLEQNGKLYQAVRDSQGKEEMEEITI